VVPIHLTKQIIEKRDGGISLATILDSESSILSAPTLGV
jgi:hypothetical protein